MLLTIITINLNNAKGLEATIASVAAQKNAQFEYLVIDGGSTDQSVPLIHRYQKHISAFISEKDHGVYHAMNKGISLAKGKFILFLNSGDTLNHHLVISQLLGSLEIDSNKDIYYSSVLFVDEEQEKAYTYGYPKQLNVDYFLHAGLCHQCTVIRKQLFDEIGRYEENYRLVSDWSFFLKAIKKNYHFQHIDQLILSNYVLNGLSTDYLSCKQERLKIIKSQHAELLPRYLSMNRPLGSTTRIWLKLQKIAHQLNRKSAALKAGLFRHYQEQRKLDLNYLITDV
ncbi:glycosyltransferase family 2 protein [Pedobacter nanyangensis]|uniref:glycosyltransferase family 2 protein n=1 Tax=Pedobacter nanyangensis TaxID=1562389 RepID=UPI000DE48FA5|nr:glycosyltransferase family 2 protein [Pedobacter nanyangensis]